LEIATPPAEVRNDGINLTLAARLREHLKELPYEVVPYILIRVIARRRFHADEAISNLFTGSILEIATPPAEARNDGMDSTLAAQPEGSALRSHHCFSLCSLRPLWFIFA